VYGGGWSLGNWFEDICNISDIRNYIVIMIPMIALAVRVGTENPSNSSLCPCFEITFSLGSELRVNKHKRVNDLLCEGEDIESCLQVCFVD